MGRPRGSKNKTHAGNGSAELRSYIERIEYCNEQQSRSQIKELKTAGYDRTTTPLGQAGARDFEELAT